METNSTFTYLIGFKIINSLIYLTVNYLAHQLKMKYSILLGNCLRILSTLIDFSIIIILLFGYIAEWYIMAYEYSIIGMLFSIFICALNWAILVRQDEQIQPVFIIGTFSFIILLILYYLFISTGLGYKGPISALLIFNAIYISCWLIFDPYAKTITRFMVSIGDKLSWVDPLIGNMLHKDVALRNVCSFNLGLLNFTYLHTSGGCKYIHFKFDCFRFGYKHSGWVAAIKGISISSVAQFRLYWANYYKWV